MHLRLKIFMNFNKFIMTYLPNLTPPSLTLCGKLILMRYNLKI